MINIDNLTVEDLIVLSNALAISFSKDRSIDEINTIGNIFEAVGSLMLLIAAQQQLLSNLKDKNASPQNTPTDVNP